MEKVLFFRTIMNEPYREHPSEDALERFLLNLLEEGEVEVVETHILACEACVDRLETLEFQIAAAKLACESYSAEQRALAQPKEKFSLSKWFTLPRLSIAVGALAACAVLLTVGLVPRQENIAAFRGAEVNYVAQWVPLALHLDAKDLPPGPVVVRVVNARGGNIWQGGATSVNDQIDVRIPRFTSTGHFLIRVYATQEDASGTLLREYSVQTRPVL